MMLTAGLLEILLLVAQATPAVVFEVQSRPVEILVERLLPLLCYLVVAGALACELVASHLLRRGLAALAAGDPAASAAALRQAARWSQGLSGIHHYDLGCLLHQTGAVHEAVAEYRNAIRTQTGWAFAEAVESPSRVDFRTSCAINLIDALRHVSGRPGPDPSRASSLPRAGRFHAPLFFFLYITAGVVLGDLLAGWLPGKIGFLLFLLLACAAATRWTIARSHGVRGRALLELGDSAGAVEDLR
ncbi:MAG: hypothetical protein HY303_10760, partial [Candidatus Wallbacteria bacterium]|nr:hypothetical protein [Candidatus Wallbacteria bacterium]